MYFCLRPLILKTVSANNNGLPAWTYLVRYHFTSHNPLLGSENCPLHFSCDDDELLPTIVCPNSTIDRPQHDEYY